VVVDLLNLQWWQAAVGVLVALGLSPAPWLAALATGRLQFAAPALAEKERALAEQKRHYEALIAEKDKTSETNRIAAEKNKDRADQVTDAALGMAKVIEANTHVIASVNEIAREASRA
jgi:hemoglobin-like flavoprotein